MAEENLQTDLSVTAEIRLYYDLYFPENARKTPSPLLVAVHGYGAHKRYMMREARAVAPDGFVIVSLQAPHQHFRQTGDGGYRVGFGWLTDYRAEESIRLHQKFVLDVVEKLSGEGLIDRKRVFLYGFSQACALNFRFAFSHPDVLRGVIGVCGGIPGDLETNETYRPSQASVFYLYSQKDEFYPLEKFQKFDALLRAFLPRYESRCYDDAAHEITDRMREDVREWLKDKIMRVSSRK
jgi:predicted esterase